MDGDAPFFIVVANVKRVSRAPTATFLAIESELGIVWHVFSSGISILVLSWVYLRLALVPIYAHTTRSAVSKIVTPVRSALWRRRFGLITPGTSLAQL